MAYVHAPKENWAKIEKPDYDLVWVDNGSLEFGAQWKQYYIRNKFIWDFFVRSATEEPRFNGPLFNEVLDITNDILCPGQSYSKIYGIELRYNEYNLEAQT